MLRPVFRVVNKIFYIFLLVLVHNFSKFCHIGAKNAQFSIDLQKRSIDTFNMAERNKIEERRRKIARYIDVNGKAEITELERILDSTEYTIRRDLIALEKSGIIIRTHGGAIKKEKEKSIWQTTAISSRLSKNADLKEKIGEYAASLINDGESLMIDGGSTTQIFSAHLLDKHNLLAVTTSPGIAEIMLGSDDCHVVLIGGELLRGTHMVSGADAEEHLMKYYVDKCIISVTGAEPEIGCYAAIPNEARLKKLMIEHSRNCILLIDHTKFRRRGFCLAFPFEKVNTVVTDSMIDEDTVQKLESKGINVCIV